jgi:hypothetical protein
MMRRLGVVVLMLVLAATAASCGRRSDPVHPDGSDYPRRYPASSLAMPEVG